MRKLFAIVLICVLFLGFALCQESSIDEDTENATIAPDHQPIVGDDSHEIPPAVALYIQAIDYLEGRDGHKQNTLEAINLLKQSAELGNSDAYLELALIHMYGEKGADRDWSLVLDYLHSAAHLGDDEAQFLLGQAHANGFGVPKSEAKAVLYYYFSAQSDNVQAKMALAHRHMHGYSVPKSCASAAVYYRQVADKVVTEYQLNPTQHVGEKVAITNSNEVERKESQKDVSDFRKFNADKGDAGSQVYMGYSHFYGLNGMEQDHQRALQYFQRAAQQGDPTALSSLGQMYANGMGGVPQNNTAALEFFRKGAEKGSAAAYNGLGYLYMYGHGVEQSYEDAAKYFKAAADHGNAEAQYNMGVLHYNGWGVAKDFTQAFHYFTLAAAQDQLLAHFQLGQMHLEGIGVPPSCQSSLKHFKNVAERGQWSNIIEEAYNNYMDSELANALFRYTQAAEQGYEVAQHNLAFLYDRDIGPSEVASFVPFDRSRKPPSPAAAPTAAAEESQGGGAAQAAEATAESGAQLAGATNKTLGEIFHEQAYNWYRKSADQGNVESLLKVGDYLYYGMGVEPSHEKAVKYYRVAAELRNPQAMFNIGYMHQHGEGLPQDFWLAKRYYDMAKETSPSAYAPVILALGNLYLHMGWRMLTNFLAGHGFELGAENGSDFIRVASEATEQSQQSGSIDLLGEEWENTVLAGLVGLLGVLLFAWTQRRRDAAQRIRQQAVDANQ